MQNIGILYNSFVCFTTGFVAFGAFYCLYRKRKIKKIEFSRGIDYFFLFSGIVWIFSGIGVFSNWIDRPEIGRLLFKWFIGGFVYIHLLPAFKYFSWSFFGKNKKMQWVFMGFFVIVDIAALFALARYGFTQPEIGYWGADVVPNALANNIFTFGIFLPGLICILIELVKRYIRMKRTKNLQENQMFGFALGFLIYAIGGIFDALGSIRSWMILLARSIIMLSSFVFYYFSTLEE